MDRDQALKIADRIMDRVEQDSRTMNRDALADELMAENLERTAMQAFAQMPLIWPENTMQKLSEALSKCVVNSALYGTEGQVSSASVSIDWSGDLPPKVKPGDVHWLTASFVTERGWTSQQMYDAGFAYRSTDEAWFS